MSKNELQRFDPLLSGAKTTQEDFITGDTGNRSTMWMDFDSTCFRIPNKGPEQGGSDESDSYGTDMEGLTD